MHYRCDNIKIKFEDLRTAKPREAVTAKLRLNENKVKNFRVLKESLDSRFHKTLGIFYVYSAEFDYPDKINDPRVKLSGPKAEKTPLPLISTMRAHPVIIGAGPAGLFAALRLTECGIAPVIVEMGRKISERSADVKKFWDTGILNTESNVQFGLGGAGTFSDAKLMTRIKSGLCDYVYEQFVRFGAPEQILRQSKPHLGTDKVRKIVSAMHKYLEEKGAQFLFDTKMTDIIITDGAVSGIIVNDSTELTTDCLILACGNASRDTFELLERKEIALQKKSFAAGVRVEHEQELINRYIYGSYASEPKLPSAQYQLTYKDEDTGRNVYTFCCCPGGLVINASSEPDGIVTNGMSFSGRSLANANSAVVVNVRAEDFASPSPLSGMLFQRQTEQKAFKAAGGTHAAPVMSIAGFLGLNSEYSTAASTVRPSHAQADFHDIFPDFILGPLKSALMSFCGKISGFSSGIMTAPETRTSSPVTVLRDKETLQSINTKGLFPAGEGSGYSGGIVSSAVDALKAADAVIKSYGS